MSPARPADPVRPSSSDPHLVEVSGLTPAERRARRRWHLDKLRLAEARAALLVDAGRPVDVAVALTRPDIEHHQRCLDALAFHSSTVRTVGGPR